MSLGPYCWDIALPREASLPHFARAAELYRSFGDTAGEAEVEYRWAETLRRLGNEEDRCNEAAPAPHFARAAQLYRSLGDTEGEANAEYQGAETDLEEDEEENAAHWVRVAQLLSASGDDVREAEAWAASAGILFKLDKYEESLPCWQQASELFSELEDWAQAGHAESYWASALYCLDRIAEAIPHWEQAAQFYLDAGSSENEAVCLLGAAEAWGELAVASRTDENIAAFSAAASAFLDWYEDARAGLAFLSQRRVFQKEWLAKLKDFAETSLSLSLGGLLWRFEQTIKGRTFQEEGAEQDLFRRLLDGHSDLVQAQRAVEQLQIECDRLGPGAFYEPFSRGKSPGAKAQREWVKELDAAEQRVRQLLADIARKSPEIVAMASVPPVRLAALQAILGPGEAYVGFLWLSKALVCFVVTAEKARVESIEGEQLEALRRWLRRARNQYERFRDWQVLRNRPRSATLLAGLPGDVSTLLISPDGDLTGMPFHCMAAPNDDLELSVLLGERCALSIIPAAGTLVQARESARGECASSYLGVACNADDAIPGVDCEVRHVVERYFAGPPPGEAVLTEHKRSVFDHHGSVRVLHLACHAGPNGLLLRRGSEWITPVDLLDLQVRADILVCTGCSSGRFAPDEGNEFLGVVRQLLVATSARAAVVSLQPVPDAAGLVFADLLFGALTGEEPALGWGSRPPTGAEPLAAAVERARGRMAELDPVAIAPLIGGLPALGAIPGSSLAIRP